jgi:hypothetical protein
VKYCVFCDQKATIDLNTLHPACKPCHDLIFSDMDPTLQAFRLGALVAAGQIAGETGEGARLFAQRAESRRQKLRIALRILNGSV